MNWKDRGKASKLAQTFLLGAMEAVKVRMGGK